MEDIIKNLFLYAQSRNLTMNSLPDSFCLSMNQRIMLILQ